jgi:acyl carrier protein
MSTCAAEGEPEPESDALDRDLKHLIVSALGLRDVDPEAIDTHAPLFDEGLGLDSLDAIQLVAVLRKTYGVAFGPGDDHTRRQLASVGTIAKLVRSSGRLGGPS